RAIRRRAGPVRGVAASAHQRAEWLSWSSRTSEVRPLSSFLLQSINALAKGGELPGENNEQPEDQDHQRGRAGCRIRILPRQPRSPQTRLDQQDPAKRKAQARRDPRDTSTHGCLRIVRRRLLYLPASRLTTTALSCRSPLPAAAPAPHNGSDVT